MNVLSSIAKADEKKQLEDFTKAAMQGLLSNPAYNNPAEKHKMIMVDALADCAVTYAKATINALNK